jgi:hypothetical protein
MYQVTAENWAKASKLGRTRYILRYGVVGWGIPVAFLFSLIQAFIDGWNTFVPRLGTSLILFPVVGILVGLITWTQMKQNFGTAKHAE